MISEKAKLGEEYFVDFTKSTGSQNFDMLDACFIISRRDVRGHGLSSDLSERKAEQRLGGRGEAVRRRRL